MACGALEKPLRGKASKPRLAFQVSAGVAGSGVLTAEAWAKLLRPCRTFGMPNRSPNLQSHTVLHVANS